MNFLDVACYVSTENLLADFQIINKILLGTRNSKLAPRTSKLAPRDSKLVPRNLSHQEL
jgi:hypothetical protein